MRPLLTAVLLVCLTPFVRGAEPLAEVVPSDAKVEKLATDMKFTEGPCWFADPAGGYLVFSDIPSNQLKKWSEREGLAVFRENSHNSNGNARDAQGRLITCEHQARRVTRTESDGTITVLADKYDGKPLNSPNDVVVKSDGTVWFTDPPYGLPRDARQAQAGQYVFRLDLEKNQLKPVATDFDRPNGLAFSPDERKLYIADSGEKTRHIRVFDVNGDGTLSGGQVFCRIDNGVPDGIRVDAAGRVFSSARDGVHIFSPDGELIGKIPLPESCANLAFGGKDGRELYMTASKSLYRIRLKTTGAVVKVEP